MRKVALDRENGAQTHFAMTYMEISREIGISPEAVERTIRRAMAKIRAEFVRRGIQFHDYLTEMENEHLMFGSRE